MRRVKLAAACVFLFLTPLFLHAENRDFTLILDAGVNYLFGYTQYGIGWTFYDPSGYYYYPIGFQISQLKFPLGSLEFYANADMTFLDMVLVSLHFDKNITTAPGKMEDSDWGYWSLDPANTWANPSSLDVFSLSDVVFNKFTIEGSVHYILPLESAFTISFGAGFIYQYIYSEMSNVDQWYPSYEEYSSYLDPSYAGHDYVPGLVSTYKVEYFVPLGEVQIEWRTGEVFSIGLLAGVTPFAVAADEDDHILRSKRSTCTSIGLGTRCRLRCRINLTPRFYTGAVVRFIYIHTAGIQSQYRYEDTIEGPAGPLGSIDEKIDMLQFSAGVHVGVSF